MRVVTRHDVFFCCMIHDSPTNDIDFSFKQQLNFGDVAYLTVQSDSLYAPEALYTSTFEMSLLCSSAANQAV